MTGPQSVLIIILILKIQVKTRDEDVVFKCCYPQSRLIGTAVSSLLDGSQEFYDSLTTGTAGCCLSFSGHKVYVYSGDKDLQLLGPGVRDLLI